MTCYGKPLPLHLITLVFLLRGTLWRSWLRHCASSRKVAGSIPDGVICTMAVEVDSASNRNEYQEYILWGKGGRCVGLTTDRHEIWEPQHPGTLKACPGLYRDSLPFV
jgi:hypothetical protein